jgi:hypothetical protein
MSGLTEVRNFSDYSLRPLSVDAGLAHREGIVRYTHDGTAVFSHGGLVRYGLDPALHIAAVHQYPAIAATFMDLNKALSGLSNSPRLADGSSLRQRFDEELARYMDLVEAAQERGDWEPDYGTYVLDHHRRDLYLIAPEFWHRLGLVTNNAKLLTDPQGHLSWGQIRAILDRAVIGFAGASVGGNILEGAAREIRFRHAKVADPDWVEITNLNRLERGSLHWLVGARSRRQDPRNPFELVRMNKAELAAYEQQLVDPYARWFVYPEGLHADTMERFLLGDGAHEPRLDVLVEEMDDYRLKTEVRRLCRLHGIDVLMLSDLGHRVQAQLQPFGREPGLALGYRIGDPELDRLLDRAMASGEREDRLAFMAGLCGDDFAVDEFAAWVAGRGEQPTSSLPQSGATAMGSGGIGGKLLALHLLGHPLPARLIFDLRRAEVVRG